MKTGRRQFVLGCAAASLLLLAGCAGSHKTVNVTAPPGEKVNVQMQARNFAFDPGVIVARKGDILVLHVNNVAGEKHNITVKNPAGKVIQSEDLPSHQTVTMEIPLDTTGSYPFYCDIDLHATLGMKGKIEVR